jgi:hypothetical protein
VRLGISSITQPDEDKTPEIKKIVKFMKKMLLIVAVAFAAMSCGNKCCDNKCCQDSCANAEVEVVEVVESDTIAE